MEKISLGHEPKLFLFFIEAVGDAIPTAENSIPDFSGEICPVPVLLLLIFDRVEGKKSSIKL